MEKKKIIKNIVRIAVVVLVIFAVHKFTQDDIKIKSRKPNVIVYDDDAMNAKRLKALTGEFYTTTSPDKELCLFDIDENDDYGTSFVVYLDYNVVRKDRDKDCKIYCDVTYDEKAAQYICVKSSTIFEGFNTDAKYRDKTTSKPWLRLYGCTRNVSDEELQETLQSVKVKMIVREDSGREYEEELDIDMEDIKISHENLKSGEISSPFFVDEELEERWSGNA